MLQPACQAEHWKHELPSAKCTIKFSSQRQETGSGALCSTQMFLSAVLEIEMFTDVAVVYFQVFFLTSSQEQQGNKPHNSVIFKAVVGL